MVINKYCQMRDEMKRLKVLSVLLLVVFIFTSCNRTEIKKNLTKDNVSDTPTAQNTEIRAVWLNYNELSMKAQNGGDEQTFRTKAEEIMKNIKSFGCNRVIIQVRAFSDAFYNSDIFPATKYLSGTEGVSVSYDALSILLEYAKKYSLSADAWVNPYRVSYNTDVSQLSENNPAKKWISENGETRNVIITDKGIFYNPACDEVKKLISDGVREILEKYDVDGIHMDDYFYPTTDAGFDKTEYDAYLNSGGKLSLDDWRRENVNSLISNVYSVIKTVKPEALFSVSPSGDIEKDCNVHYADVKLWCSQEGYIDVIMPQLYYGFLNDSKPFSKTADEWSDIVTNDNIKLCFGLAVYKSGKADAYAGAGADEWINCTDIISRQLSYIKGLQNYGGFSFYSYSYCFSGNITENAKKELQIVGSMIQ